MRTAGSRGRGIAVVLVGLGWVCGCSGTRAGSGQGAEQCTYCHGDATASGDQVMVAAPPRALEREGGGDRAATSNPGVGAHQIHLRAGRLSRAVECTDCHVVPRRDGQPYSSVPGHLDHTGDRPDRADLTFAGRAVLAGVQAEYDYDGHTCQTYCHGVTLSGGTTTVPTWNQVGAGQAECGSCHGLPPTSPDHPRSSRCDTCHPTVDASLNIIDRERHIDGTVDLTTATCRACHGSSTNAAPPLDTAGRSSTSLTSVGAHQAHLTGETIATKVGCGECHLVPSNLEHVDGTAVVTFSARAVAGGVSAGWNGTTCQVYCHGQTLSGGTNTTPEWTRVDGSQAACGACHGLPPAGDHPQETRCYFCHRTMDAAGDLARKDLHVNGVVDVNGTDCNSCHGSAANAAPPVDSQGRTDATLRSVGAHQAHLTAGTIAAPVACAECHTVPTDLGHLDGAAQVDFGPRARARGFASPAWDGATCAVYCHGGNIVGGSNQAPAWTGGSGEAACGTCHSLPPGGTHDAVGAQSCSGCHGMVVNADNSFKDKALHVNGTVDVSAGSACDSCHQVPPPTGSHLKHYGGTMAQASYGDTRATAALAAAATPTTILGCGNCHPRDAAKHHNGVVDVELYDAAAPAGTLKQLHPATASYTPGPVTLWDSRKHSYTLGTCADVYCHSGRTWTTPGGVPRPTRSATPAAGEFTWDGAYPITYPAALDTYVTVTRVYRSVTWGAASPGCGGCHGNPPQTSTATGNAAGAGDSHAFINDSHQTLHNRFSTVMGEGAVACRACHKSTITADPAAIADARFHVNGANDVAFDQARTYPVMGFSQSLVGATYDPVTRECAVACHRAERVDRPRWGTPYRTQNQPECLACHNGVMP